jgi:predicted RNA binding protein YcfA (HicA-like mRNA interferase family)
VRSQLNARSLAGRGIDPLNQGSHRAKMKVRDVVRLLEADGWYLVRTRGSHHQFRHPTKPGLVTIPGTGGDDVAPGTLNSILKQAGLKP